ncbi:MAG: hypothetical protein IJY28_02860 [Clostridia bacterium]|nr:hypothetical protein [Clostridia bacterium]
MKRNKIQFDAVEKGLLLFTFAVLMFSYVFGGTVRPLTTKEVAVMVIFAFEPIFALLLRRAALGRKANNPGNFYFKVGLYLFGALALLLSSVYTLLV